MGTGKKQRQKQKEKAEQRPVARVALLLEWPGVFGWFGTLFGVAAVWFLISGIVLATYDGALAEGGPEAREVAQSARWFGFGDRFVSPMLAYRSEDPKEGLTLPRPLGGTTLKRVRVAVAANARASIVFAVLALFLTCFLWGMRLFEPSIRAEYAEMRAAAERKA
jgi:hypothetical protein